MENVWHLIGALAYNCINKHAVNTLEPRSKVNAYCTVVESKNMKNGMLIAYQDFNHRLGLPRIDNILFRSWQLAHPEFKSSSTRILVLHFQQPCS